RQHRLCSRRLPSVLQEALTDNTQTPVPEQVCFRCDFPAWLLSLTHRHRQLVEEMARGHRTLDLANKFGITPGRVSQFRLRFHADWLRFQGEAPAEPPPNERLRPRGEPAGPSAFVGPGVLRGRLCSYTPVLARGRSLPASVGARSFDDPSRRRHPAV